MVEILQPSRFSDFDRIDQNEKIGEGTYAIVYIGHAISKNVSTKVAIKKIKPAFTDGLDMSAIREIKYLKELSHPNVIKLLEVINASKLSLVLEFLESDLEMIIKNTNVVFSGPDIKSWMLMLLRGLNHIHSNFILHRVFYY
jgi:cyclin-dependent kinase 7